MPECNHWTEAPYIHHGYMELGSDSRILTDFWQEDEKKLEFKHRVIIDKKSSHQSIRLGWGEFPGVEYDYILCKECNHQLLKHIGEFFRKDKLKFISYKDHKEEFAPSIDDIEISRKRKDFMKWEDLAKELQALSENGWYVIPRGSYYNNFFHPKTKDESFDIIEALFINKSGKRMSLNIANHEEYKKRLDKMMQYIGMTQKMWDDIVGDYIGNLFGKDMKINKLISENITVKLKY